MEPFEVDKASALSASELERLLSEGRREDQWLDYKGDYAKKADADVLVEIAEDLSSLGNAQGGWILVGIAEDGERRPFRLLGVHQARAVTQRIRQAVKTHLQPRPDGIDVAEVSVHALGGEGTVVAISVAPHRKPVAIVHGDRTYYKKRFGSENANYPPEELAEAFGRGLPTHTGDDAGGRTAGAVTKAKDAWPCVPPDPPWLTSQVPLVCLQAWVDNPAPGSVSTRSPQLRGAILRRHAASDLSGAVLWFDDFMIPDSSTLVCVSGRGLGGLRVRDGTKYAQQAIVRSSGVVCTYIDLAWVANTYMGRPGPDGKPHIPPMWLAQVLTVFSRLARQVLWGFAAGSRGSHLRFRQSWRNAIGLPLYPCHPGARFWPRGRPELLDGGAPEFTEGRLDGSVHLLHAGDDPDSCAMRMSHEVYQHVGWGTEHVPCFRWVQRNSSTGGFRMVGAYDPEHLSDYEKANP